MPRSANPSRRSGNPPGRLIVPETKRARIPIARSPSVPERGSPVSASIIPQLSSPGGRLPLTSSIQPSPSTQQMPRLLVVYPVKYVLSPEHSRDRVPPMMDHWRSRRPDCGGSPSRLAPDEQSPHLTRPSFCGGSRSGSLSVPNVSPHERDHTGRGPTKEWSKGRERAALLDPIAHRHRPDSDQPRANIRRTKRT